MEHTKGPWAVRKCAEFPSLAEVVRADGSAFEEGYFLSRPEEMANAHLIAAAPELLEALAQATDQIERDYEATPLDGRGALIRKLRAVIAKASPTQSPEGDGK